MNQRKAENKSKTKKNCYAYANTPELVIIISIIFALNNVRLKCWSTQ